MSLTKEAVSAVFIRGYEAALCNHGIPDWSIRQEADKAADEVLALGSSTPHGDDYLEGRQDIADAIRQDIAALRAEAITAERKDAYDEALAAVTARLGDS
jgi:hypothetical protein